jgi:hypothetical protein
MTIVITCIRLGNGFQIDKHTILPIIEILAKPNRVTFAWNWSDIKNITRENKKILGFASWKNVIEDFQGKHTFCANKKLEEFWNFRMWER